jgi:heme A synthase
MLGSLDTNQSSGQAEIDHGFVRLALGAAVVTFLMIIIGAITRVSESGMGCGTYWPDCNGRLIPEFQSIETVIEFGHRIFALIVGIFALAVLVQAVRKFRGNASIIGPAVAGIVLYFVQSGLGAITVKMSNHWVSVLLHLGNSMFLLATYLILWVNAQRQVVVADRRPTLTRIEVLIGLVLTFIIAMLGAAVMGNGATKACVGWPLCMGEVWPVNQGPYQVLNMTHRIVAGLLGVLILFLIWRVNRSNANSLIRKVVGAALVMYVAQAAIGAGVVLFNDRNLEVIVQSLHVTFAAATWSVMVTAGAITWLQQQSKKKRETQNGQVVVSSAITSN